MNLSLKILIFCAAVFIFFNSCTSVTENNFYQKTITFQNQQWSDNEKPSFNFDVSDTSSLYNIYVVIRHTDAYKFNNIWLNITDIAPNDTSKTQQLNLNLGDNKKWLGSEMDDIIETRILISQNPVKLKKGKYFFSLQQIMREQMLTEVLNVGIRIEKI